MPFDEDPRTAAIRALPVLSRTLFLLHNFHDVDIRAIAEGIGTDTNSAAAYLSDARNAIFRHWPLLDGAGHASYGGSISVTAPGERLRLDYRAALEATFVGCGYVGTVQWSAVGGDVHEDENAAAAFIASRLHPVLRNAVARSQYDGVAMLDLWRRAPP